MILIFDIIILILLILANGFFSLSEFAMVSSRKVKLKQMAEDKRAGADTALLICDDQTNFLSSIQIGITLIGVCTGAYGGATFAQYLEPYFKEIPLIGEYSHIFSMVIIILVITYFSIVIGELVPKRIGLAEPEIIACRIAPVFLIISRISSPFSYLTSGLTNFIIKLTGFSKVSSSDVIEEEIHLLLEEGAESGVIDETKQDMVESVFELDDRQIVDLMVPRPDIIALNSEDSLENNLEIMLKTRHTRYPVYSGNLDSMIGILSVRDLWASSLSGKDLKISEVMKEIVVVPDHISALDLIRKFRESTSPLAIILDEYGSVIGLITLHDLLEALVGDLSLVDQDENEPRIIRRNDGTWLVDGKVTIEELKEKTGIECTDESTKRYFRTIAGFILYQSGEIPSTGDKYTWNNYTFEIVDMDNQRIDKIIISQDPSENKIKTDKIEG
jgi:putative hemolysin